MKANAVSRRAPRCADTGALAAYANALIAQARACEAVGQPEGPQPSGPSIKRPDPFLIQLVDPDELADAIKGSQGAVDDGGRSVRHVLEKLLEDLSFDGGAFEHAALARLELVEARG